VWFEIDGAVMGSHVADPGEKEVAITVKIDDPDETDSQYTIHHYQDKVGDGELPDIIESSEVVKTGETRRTSLQHQGGTHELFFAHFDQENSQDDTWTAPI
jgi:hypothetical protein